MSWLDKTISWINPEKGLRRAQARRAIEAMNSRKPRARYEGAIGGHRTSKWSTPGSSQNAETRFDLPALRDRSRDLVRNDPYAAKAINVMASTIIGRGMTPKLPTEIEGLAKLWKAFCRELDFDGRTNFLGLQTLIVRSIMESGESIIFKKPAPSEKKLKVPFQIQVADPDFLDERKDSAKAENGGYQVQGVHFNDAGQRIGYWIFDRHPGDGKARSNSDFIDADKLWHLYEMKRPGQARGVPLLAPVILKLRDLNEYDDAALLAKKIQACFAGFITTTNGQVANKIVDQATGTENSTPNNTPLGRIEAGTLMGLAAGEDIKFSEPSVSNDSDFLRAVLRAIAAGLDIPYELLTGDLSQVNYSSIRTGLISFRARIENLRAQIIIPFCEALWAEFAKAAILSSKVKVPEEMEWTTPPFYSVDPLKETLAMLYAVRAGFISLPDAIAQGGNDPNEQAKEIASFNTVLDELKIVLDSDPRKANKAGALQSDSPLQQSLTN